jgi:hypothetical protein
VAGVQKVLAGVVSAVVLGVASAAFAQPTPGAETLRPGRVIEVGAGWVGFGDEGVIHHGLVASGYRHYFWRRVSIGPELQYTIGPDSDRDLIVTGNVMIDVLGPTVDRPRRTTPFVVLGAGLFRHSSRFGPETFSSTEGAFTAGVGVRTWIGERTFVAADARVGWEPHLRVAAIVGFALK